MWYHPPCDKASNANTSQPPTNLSTSIEPAASASPQRGAPTTTNRRAAVVGGAVGGIAGTALVLFALYLVARTRANKQSRKQEEAKPVPQYTNDEPNPRGIVSEAGQASVCEADSRQALPHEVDSRQNLPHEAGSGPLHEMSSRMRVGSGQNIPPEADSGLL